MTGTLDGLARFEVQQAHIDLMNQYAHALDVRDWSLLASLFTAATTGLREFSHARMTESKLGSWMALGEPNSLMSAPPEKALPSPVSTIALTASSVFALFNPLTIPKRLS